MNPMSTPEWLKELLEILKVAWHPAATVVMLLTVWATYRKARLMWQRRHFMTRINFTINYIENGTLKFRTLREDDLGTILLNNEHGKKVVLRAAHRSTLDRPFLELPRRDAWTVLNAILNELSEQFAVGHLARSMGAPVKSQWYVFGLTCEKHREVRMNKLRVMIIEKSLLENIDRYEDLRFERESHHIRLQTLKRMREIQLDPTRSHNLMEIELPVC